MKQKLIKYIITLTLIIGISSISVRVLTSNQTLSEYAEQNPDIAYSQKDSSSSELLNSNIENNANPNGPSSATTDMDTQVDPSQPNTADASVNTTDNSTNSSLNYEVDDTAVEDLYIYQEGFSSSALPATIIAEITGKSFTEPNDHITYDDLRYLRILYYDFNATIQKGELICNQYIANDLLEIFYELYQNQYQIEEVALVDKYNADDNLSMEANNTSCFNYRVVEGTDRLSKHAYGLAIDVNPFYNPYVVYAKDGSGTSTVSPAGSEIYADRTKEFPYKIDKNDLAYQLFTEHGFVWGGTWNSCKDYQHFEKAMSPVE